MVHQADQSDAILRAEGIELFGLRANLGAQMKMMTDLELAAGMNGQNLGRERAGIGPLPHAGGRGHRPDPECVEDRGDPAGGQLAVMCQDRGVMRPVHTGPRLEVTLQIVGMQLDQSGDQQVARAIDHLAGGAR